MKPRSRSNIPNNIRYQTEVMRSTRVLGHGGGSGEEVSTQIEQLGALRGGSPRAYSPEYLPEEFNSDFNGYGFTASQAGAMIAGQMDRRRYLYIQNNGVGYILVAFGAPANVFNAMRLNPGEKVEFSNWPPRNSVYVTGEFDGINGTLIQG